MGSGYLMAFDVGSGSGRCVLVNPDTAETFTAGREWSHPGAPGTAGLGYDLDLDDIWAKLSEACADVLRASGVDPGSIAGVSTTSMRNTTVLLGDSGEVLLAAPNQDARALGEALGWAAGAGKRVHEVSGHWPSPLFTASRLLWLRANRPEAFAGVRLALSLSDWVALRMGGRPAAERSQAGETLLFDQVSRDWSDELINSLELDRSIFPGCVDAGTPLGELSADAAADLGLVEGTVIAAGGADTQCALLGAGAVEAGDLCVVAGTTMPVQLVTGGFLTDPEGRLWSGQHVLPGLFVLESNGMSTGSVVDWLAHMIYADYADPVSMLFNQAGLSEPGGAGAYSTFGACLFDARRLNIPVGNITMSHMVTPGSRMGRAHLSRSVIEGVALSARANLEQLLEAAGCEVAEMRVAAGMSRSELWTGIVADVTGRKVLVPGVVEVSGLGAAICAGAGAGVFEDLRHGARSLGGTAREQEPGPAAERYESLYFGWSQACGMREATDDHVSSLLAMSLFERSAAPSRAAEPSFRPRMLVTASMDPDSLAELGSIGDVTYRDWREEKRVLPGGVALFEALAGFHVFVTEMDIVDFDALCRLPDLRAVVTCRGNPVNVDAESAAAFGVAVMNTPGRNADAVADLAVAFMVMLARRMPESERFLKESGAERGDMAAMGRAYMRLRGRELWGKTVGLLGLGSVGRAVAGRLRGFGARVVFCDPAVSAGDAAPVSAEKVSFDELLEASDFVSLHAPGGDETRALVGREAFARMKPGACFVNTARASLVDEEALAEALESGRLAGAALDVFQVEPPGSDDRLVVMDNVIVTPHIGGNTEEIGAHQGVLVAAQLRRLLAGERPDHLVNPEVLDRFSWAGPRPEPTDSERERLAAREKPTMTS